MKADYASGLMQPVIVVERGMSEDDDISDEELEALHKRIDAEIAERGLPSDEGLRREIERLNKSAKNRRTRRGPPQMARRSARLGQRA